MRCPVGSAFPQSVATRAVTDMVSAIDRDLSRFKQIVRGKIRENLRKYVTHGEMIGRKGHDLSASRCRSSTCRISAMARTAGRRRPGRRRSRQPIGRGQDDGDGAGPGRRSARARHIREVDISLEELAAMLGDELRAAADRAQGESEHPSRRTSTPASAASAPSRCGT